jgi:uncharacterized membrane protein YfcA
MLDLSATAAGLGVGFVVGLTGMGGGALMTPILVLLFHWQPLAAVSSDVVAAVVMKPVGGGVHWRRGTVNLELAKWLIMGSVPSAFLGVVLLRQLGHGEQLEALVKAALGVALLVVALGLVVRPALRRRRPSEESSAPIVVKPVSTLLVGIFGGLVVGMTSVGSGSLMMIFLMILYPRLKLSQLVGTDLVQAVPLVASAALGHVLFGDLHIGLTLSILVGSVPGIYFGARLSSRAPDHVIRPILAVVLLASSLKLLGLGNLALGVVVLIAASIGAVVTFMSARDATRLGIATPRSSIS